MKRLVMFVLASGLIWAISATAYGEIISVPSPEYPTIQEGINAADTGDTVQVAAGTYLEKITMKSGVVIQGAGQGVSIIDGEGSGPVVTANGVNSAAKLDGFTITNGNTDAGGGMYNSNSSPTVSNCTFSGNTATVNGGGMYNYNSSPTVINCTFSENSASFIGIAEGGGMYNYNNSSPTVTNCTFTGNTSGYNGGGMSNIVSSPTVTNCNFSGNSADAHGGGMYNYNSSPTVTNCTFSENATSLSAGSGAGMSNKGSSPTVSKCSFFNNHSGIWGGGMSNHSNSSPIVTSCIFLGNWAQDNGGGMYNENSSPTVTNCIFFKHQAMEGGGMYNYNSSPTVTNCTFSKNGGGDATLYNESNSSVTVTNCILWGDDSLWEIRNRDTSSCSVTYSDIDWWSGTYPGTGNINADPKFVDQANGDLHLQQGSPCIDAGTSDDAPLTDMVDNPRFDAPWIPNTGGGTYPYYDMGALEFVETVSPPDPPSGPVGGTKGTSYTYSTGGASSNLQHTVQYFFDWGDGTNSGWLAEGTTNASKSWVSPGIYLVRAQARCATHTDVVSDWSTSLSVDIGPPSAATLISPTGTIDDTTPTYTWNAVSNSAWYCLYVNDATGNKINQWYTRGEAGCASGTGTCSVTPTREVIGSSQWWVRTYNSAGLGDWSSGMTFTAPSTPPSAATLVSPTGAISDTTPTYTWNAVSTATWYCLYVNDATGIKVNKWYAAAEAGCASGVGTCSVTPTTEVRGAGQWWVRTYNSAGLGDWSSGMAFTAPTPTDPPGVATQVSPTGTISDTTPTYTWNPVASATWYQLWVGDSSGTKVNQWYAAAEAGCPSGVGTCSVTPTTEVRGAGQWWVRTYNSAGLGGWSSGLPFTAPAPGAPAAAIQVSPSGTINDTTPTYTWNPVATATWYQLWVGDSSGTKVNQWFPAAEAGCADGVGTCSVTPSTMVLGSYSWYIRAYNSGGLGSWSAGMSFTVSP